MDVQYEGAAKAQTARGAMSGGNVASAPPTVHTFLQDNARLIKEAHEALSQLEAKLDSILPKADNGAISPGMPVMAANSSLAAELRDQGEAIQGLIRRLNSLRYAVDL